MKDRPGFMTAAACCNDPMRDISSRLVQHLQPRQTLVASCSQQSLSAGRCSCMATVSTSMLRTERVVTGPSDLSGSMGIPSSWKACRAETIDDAHCVECGSPAKMKSST